MGTCRGNPTAGAATRDTGAVHRRLRSKRGPVLRCTSIANPLTCSVNDSARSMRDSVIPVALRASLYLGSSFAVML